MKELVVVRDVARGVLEARAGSLAIRWDQARGGLATIAAHGPAVALDAIASGTADNLRARQSHDPHPRVTVLEEGVGGVRVRSEFLLMRGKQTIGEGLQEILLASSGTFTVATCLQAWGMRGPITRLGIDIRARSRTARQHRGCVVLHGPADLVTLDLRAAGERPVVAWDSERPPFYARWPSRFDQFSLDPTTYGWEHQSGAGVHLGGADPQLNFYRAAPGLPSVDGRGILVGRVGPVFAEDLELPEAQITVQGAEPTYDQLDRAWHVQVPATAPVQVRANRFQGDAPVSVRLHLTHAVPGLRVRGSHVSAQLVSESGRTDDPLVPVDAPPSEAGEEVLLLANPAATDTHITVDFPPRLSTAYQRRDNDRRITIHDPDDRRPLAWLSLRDLHLHDLRFPGASDIALHAMPLFWFRYLAKNPNHRANVLERAWTGSPNDLPSIRIASESPDGRVRSTMTASFSVRSGSLQVDVGAILEGASAWELPAFEFADLFPERFIHPSRWRTRRVLFLAAGTERVYRADDPYPELALDLPVPALDALGLAHAHPSYGPVDTRGPAVLAFDLDHASLLVRIEPPARAGLATVLTLCEHWADVHLDQAMGGADAIAPSETSLEGVAVPGTPARLEARYRLQVGRPQSLTKLLEAARGELAGKPPPAFPAPRLARAHQG